MNSALGTKEAVIHYRMRSVAQTSPVAADMWDMLDHNNMVSVSLVIQLHCPMLCQLLGLAAINQVLVVVAVDPAAAAAGRSASSQSKAHQPD
jgi:hypothetical protein